MSKECTIIQGVSAEGLPEILACGGVVGGGGHRMSLDHHPQERARGTRQGRENPGVLTLHLYEALVFTYKLSYLPLRKY
jgi:hypothetical protein